MDTTPGTHAFEERELAFRLASTRVAIALTGLAASGSAIYALATWDRPNRATLLIVAAIALASIPVVLALPLERIVRGRWREPFFVFWTGFLLVCIAAATHPERISARLGL